jgi:hypothetical protein
VNYSPEWQTDIRQGELYLLERAPLLFDLVRHLKQDGKPVKPHFFGAITLVQIPSSLTEEETLSHLSNFIGGQIETKHLHDIQRRITLIEQYKYFNNIAVENYRTWQVESIPDGVLKLPRHRATEQGIQISGDFNDRFAFQEREIYSTTKNEAAKIIKFGLDAVRKSIEKFTGQLV